MYIKDSVMEYTYKMSDEDTAKLIKLRASNDALFTGKRNAAKLGWRAILKELGLQGKMRSDQAAKKWENLKKKYKELKYPPAGHGTEPAEVTSSPWQWFHLMNEAMEGRLAGSAPMVMASSCGTDDEDVVTSPARKRKKMDEKSEILEFFPGAEREETIGLDVKDGLVMDSDVMVTNSERMALEQEKVELETERVGLERERAGVETERLGLERERVVLETERVGLDRELAALDRERAALERERATVERDKATLERQRALLEKERSALDRDRAALERDRAILERDRAELERDLVSMKNRSSELRNSTDGVGMDTACLDRRERFLVLFERLVEKL